MGTRPGTAERGFYANGDDRKARAEAGWQTDKVLSYGADSRAILRDFGCPGWGIYISPTDQRSGLSVNTAATPSANKYSASFRRLTV